MTQHSSAIAADHPDLQEPSRALPIPAYEPPVGAVLASVPRAPEPELDPPGESATILDFPASRRPEPPPDPRQWAQAMVVAILEALHGARSPMQLRRWLSPPVHAAVQTRACIINRAAATPPRIGLHSCHVLEMHEGCVEVFAVVEVGARHRAVALRMQTYDGRWRVTALEMG